MKIEIDIDEKYSDVEVDIKTPRLTQCVFQQNSACVPMGLHAIPL